MMSHKDVVEELRREALNEPEFGWLSDMGSYHLDFDESNQSITFSPSPDQEPLGSIDLSQLAEVVMGIASRNS